MGKLKHKCAYLAGLVQKHGFVGLVIKWIEKKTEKTDLYYRSHYEEFLVTEEELLRQKESQKGFAYRPKISIVVPAYRTPEYFLKELLDSVVGQSYDNWELCIADGSCEAGISESTRGTECKKTVQAIVSEYQKQDSRIKYLALAENGGISRNTNAGFQMAKGEYIALLDHDDVLAKNALYEMVRTMNERKEQPMLLYSDEDKIPADAAYHFEPHFKMEFNEELLNHYNYICHFLLFHRSLLEVVKGLNPEFDGAQDYDFVLRCSENLKKEQIAYVKKLLYHWRVHDLSTAGFSGYKDYAYEASIRAVQEHLERMQEKIPGFTAKALYAKGREFVSIKRELSDASMEQYRKSWMIGLSAEVSPRDKDWADHLILDSLGHKDRIGMVGGKLIDRKGIFGRVCSAGYSYKTSGEVIARFSGLSTVKKGYYRKAVVPQQVSAVDLGFCVIDREAYQFVGGVDERLPEIYQGVDLAFRLRKAGYQVILDAGVAAVDQRKMALSGKEKEEAMALLDERWHAFLVEGDPFYNESFCGNDHL